MPMVPLDDHFHSHRKILGIATAHSHRDANEAAGVQARALSWAGANPTDGHIPAGVDEMFAGARRWRTVRDRLTTVGLRETCTVPGHGECSIIHDWGTINDPAEEVLARKRASDAERQRRRRANKQGADLTRQSREPSRDTVTGQSRDASDDVSRVRATRAGASIPNQETTTPSIEPEPPRPTDVDGMAGIPDEDLDTLARHAARAHPGWDVAGTRKNLALARDGVAAAQPWPTFVNVVLNTAANPDTQTPGRFQNAAIWPTTANGNGHRPPRVVNPCQIHPAAGLRDGKCAGCFIDANDGHREADRGSPDTRDERSDDELPTAVTDDPAPQTATPTDATDDPWTPPTAMSFTAADQPPF